MLVISVRGALLRTETGRPATREEIRAALDGARQWRRICTVVTDGVEYIVLCDYRADSKYLGQVNKLASEICDQTVRGPVAFLIKGIEI